MILGQVIAFVYLPCNESRVIKPRNTAMAKKIVLFLVILNYVVSKWIGGSPLIICRCRGRGGVGIAIETTVRAGVVSADVF